MINRSLQVQENNKSAISKFVLRRGVTAAGWLAVVANVLFVLFLFHTRNTYHVDELWSFAHANSTQGAFLVPGVTASFMLEEFEEHLLHRWHPGP